MLWKTHNLLIWFLVCDQNIHFQIKNNLNGVFLNEAGAKVEQKLKDDTENATITLIQDGCSSISNNPMIGCNLHTRKEAYMLNTL